MPSKKFLKPVVAIVPPTSKEMLTIRQVADEMQVHSETVRGWVQAGELVAVDIGRVYRISRTDFEDFKRRRRTDQKHSDDKG